MTEQSTQISLSECDADCLVLTVAEMLSTALRRSVRIEGLTREPSPFATLFPAEVLRATLDDGTQTRLFLKHLGPEQSEQPDKQRPDRELRVYETLLRDSNLSVPRYYGSRHNPATGRLDLYLEYVDDWSLRYHHLDHWFTAARRLGAFQAHFARQADFLRSCDFLLRLDVHYLLAWSAHAVSAVAIPSRRLADTLHDTLKDYPPVCALLAEQPLTLVHNDLAPKNVLADRSVTPARIYFVDWELAGAGCGLLDLVHLKYGLDPAAEQDMLTAYRSAADATNLLPRDDDQFDRLLAACELHKTLYRLAHSPAWNLPQSTIERWVAEAAQFMQRVRNTTGSLQGEVS